MNHFRWIAVGVALLCAAPAWAQSRFDANVFKQYGGKYSTDCRAAGAPLARVVADALMVEVKGKRMTGRNVQTAYSYFGQSAPPEYQVALISEVRKDLQLVFIVFRDGAGPYLTMGGEPEVEAALGKSLLSQKFRSCENARAAAVSEPASNPTAKSTVIGPPELLMDASFKSVYYKALGPLVKEPWLAKLDGPAPPVKAIRVDGKEYSLVSACKNHDCADNNTVLLYSSAQGVVYGKVFLRRRSTLIGGPSARLASELDRLWASEWRKNG